MPNQVGESYSSRNPTLKKQKQELRKINFIALSWEPESLKLEEKEAQGEEGVRVGSTCRALVFKSMKP